ncbi:Hypothetical predicted protein [Mytilus galloprovincialis]|uniref:DZIP3-like HEPN domain-containing protein n=1 Tax=Mytilus galloprovincialis TaxID=29158 RepID=A0A8B6CBU2_MYTGA|nr:Hypothetical predicted protein [Mytilus galloprovincialis]
MAANVDIEKQFLRLFMFSHKISLPVVRTYFVSSVLGSSYNNDIITFLEHHKHELFHLVGDYQCCQCTNLPSLQPRCTTFCLRNDQFRKLYDVGNSKPGHFTKGSGGRIFQQCLCCITAKKDTNPKTYDLSLLIALINNCVRLSDNNMLWLNTIRKLRNTLCHVHDFNDLTNGELQTWWGNLECSVVNLAGEVHALPAYKESIELLVETFKCADYSRDTITPLIEAVKAEIYNNMDVVIQHQTKVADRMNRQLEQYEEQRNLDKNESQSLLFAIHKDVEIIKDRIKTTEDAGKDPSKEKYMVELKISTEGNIGEKNEEIKQFFMKAMDMCNLVAPFEVKYVCDGSITVVTLLSVDILKNEEEFSKAILNFLDQMVTHCCIDSSVSSIVKVKITVFVNEQGMYTVDTSVFL